MLCVLFFCVTLWEIECSHYMIQHTNNTLGSFFSHVGKVFLSQSAQSSRRFLAHISSPQNASGIQSSQSVTANVGTNKGQQVAYILLIGVSRWSRPFPSGEGKGEGPSSFWNPVCSVPLCSLWEKICHSLFVIMSFCLTKITSFSPSLCYSVFKKTICLPLSLCHYVFKKYLSPSLSLCYSVWKRPSWWRKRAQLLLMLFLFFLSYINIS